MSAIDNASCPLCKRECEADRNISGKITTFSCNHCGCYTIRDDVGTENYELLASMYFYLQHKNSRKKHIYFVKDETKFEDNKTYSYIGVGTLEAIYPRTFSQRIDMILMNLARIYSNIGQEIMFTDIELEVFDLIHDENKLQSGDILLSGDIFRIQHMLRVALFVDKNDFKERNSEIDNIFLLLSEMGFISTLNVEEFMGRRNVLKKYKISANGWFRIQELEASNKAISQGFIAMWFDPKMDSAKKEIISAIENSGYASMIISDKEHNKQIVPEILYEISQSSFIVADLTGHRNGVYYEAGYAHALGKEVILTCSEESFEKRHFDVSQKNMIVWNDVNDLYERLLKRIEATVGKNS